MFAMFVTEPEIVFPCCAGCTGLPLLILGVLGVRSWRAGRLTGDNLRSATSAWVATFLVAFLPGAVLFTLHTYGDRQLGRLLAGDQGVSLTQVEFSGHGQTLTCDDAVTLRYLERCLRDQRREEPAGWDRLFGSQYLTLDFRGVGRVRCYVTVFPDGLGFWRGKDPGDGRPNAHAVFTEPMPPGMREIVAFLKGERQERRVHIGPAE